ncbi:MAG: amidase [Deferrisomatales bacterium]
MKKLNELTAMEAVAAVATGEVTAESLVRACLARIAEREPAVGAWEHLDPEGALARARELDRGPSRGPLHGVPVGVKDIFDTADLPTAYGSPIYRGHRPAWDAASVALLRGAGAVALGKTVTTEFAFYHPGVTRNPRDPAHTPGGSSSGSAAAVADLMVPLALGTQTAGSVIRPASFCGVVGFKPTFGWVSRAGVKPLAEGLDTLGGFARSVEDVALLASVLAVRPALRLGPIPGGPPRIGRCRTHEWDRADPATAAAWEEAGRRFAAAGAVVSEVTLPEAFRGLADAQKAIMAFEAARALAFEAREHRGRLSPELLALLDAGAEGDPALYDAARALAGECRARLSEVLGDCDALLVPSAVGEAPRGLGATGDPLFNRVWTLLGGPCVNLPGLTGPGGLPVGVQLVGRPGDDARVLAAARWAEGALPAP